MKKLLALMLSLSMVISFTACSKKDNPFESTAPAETISGEEQTSSEEITDEETEAEETKAAANDSNADVADAIEGSATTETDAAGLNQWVKCARYATSDSTYHTIYTRITKVTTQTADAAYVQDAIDLNNQNSSDYNQIDVSELKIPDDAELVVFDYDVYVPADFPTESYGIVSPDMYFSARNIGGGGIPSADGSVTYIGMGSVEKLATEADPKYEVGNTYSFRGIFVMVKGYEDYLLTSTSYPDGTVETSSDIMYTMYFNIK